MSNVAHPHDNHTDPVLRELQAIRRELVEQRRMFTAFAKVFLRSKFPYGVAADEFSDRDDRRRYG